MELFQIVNHSIFISNQDAKVNRGNGSVHVVVQGEVSCNEAARPLPVTKGATAFVPRAIYDARIAVPLPLIQKISKCFYRAWFNSPIKNAGDSLRFMVRQESRHSEFHYQLLFVTFVWSTEKAGRLQHSSFRMKHTYTAEIDITIAWKHSS
jgi:hypothetical protein